VQPSTEPTILLAGGFGVVAGLSVTGVALARYIAEQRRLRGIARALFAQGRVASREDFVSLKRFLGARIRFDPAQKNTRRTWLRASAVRLLETGTGFCGESARVAIRLLQLGGVRAHRLYLRGPRWGHVAVEHRWEGSWRLFDGHADPATLPADDQLGRIDTSDLECFPNANKTLNPWTASGRLGLSCRWAVLRWLSGWRPPRWLALVGECPDLIYAAIGVGLVLGGSALLGAAL
jgi:hypothetical protein